MVEWQGTGIADTRWFQYEKELICMSKKDFNTTERSEAITGKSKLVHLQRFRKLWRRKFGRGPKVYIMNWRRRSSAYSTYL